MHYSAKLQTIFFLLPDPYKIDPKTPYSTTNTVHQVIQKINKKQYKFIPFSQCQNNKIGTAEEAEQNINARGEMMEDGLGPVVLAPDVQHEHAGNEEEGHHQHRHRPHLEHNNGFYDAKLDSEMCKR